MSHAKIIFACRRIKWSPSDTLIDLIPELFTFGELKEIGTKQNTIEGILLISFVSSSPSPRLWYVYLHKAL